MKDFRENDTFTTYFKDMVEEIKGSDELAQFIKNQENGKVDKTVEMDDKFKEDVLTVVNVIKTCEEDSKKIDWISAAGAFFSSAVTLCMTNAAVQTGQYGSAAVTGVLTISLIALAISSGIKDKKRAMQDAVDVKLAAGLDDNTLEAILKQMAIEGNGVAANYFEHYCKKDKGKTL